MKEQKTINNQRGSEEVAEMTPEKISETKEQETKAKDRTVYCHFSFRRPKGKDYALFAVAMYSDFEGKKLIVSKTRKFKMWENHQFITAIQSYEHALQSIYEWQGMMVEAGIKQVMLVTDNSTLAGWIENPKKNKAYYPHMNKAIRMYKVGAPKEIAIGVGLCEPRDAEKSYKYCKEEKLEKDETKLARNSDNENLLNIDKMIGVQTISDIMESDVAVPEITGMAPIK